MTLRKNNADRQGEPASGERALGRLAAVGAALVIAAHLFPMASAADGAKGVKGTPTSPTQRATTTESGLGSTQTASDVALQAATAAEALPDVDPATRTRAHLPRTVPELVAWLSQHDAEALARALTGRTPLRLPSGDLETVLQRALQGVGRGPESASESLIAQSRSDGGPQPSVPASASLDSNSATNEAESGTAPQPVQSPRDGGPGSSLPAPATRDSRWATRDSASGTAPPPPRGQHDGVHSPDLSTGTAVAARRSEAVPATDLLPLWGGLDEASSASPTAATTPATRAAEPIERPSVEQEALAAALQGGRFVDAPASAALDEVVARLREAPSPQDEVYALVKVTDRRTGERRMFARGSADPDIIRHLHVPETAPPGFSYAEHEDLLASDGFEIATSSVTRHAKSGTPSSLTKAEEAEQDLRRRNEDGGLSHRIDGRLREKILSGEIDPESAKRVEVAIHLRGVPRLDLQKVHDVTAGGLLLTGLELQAERERRIIARKQEIGEIQRPLIHTVESLGGTVHYASWMSGSVRASVPARAIVKLASHAHVFRLDLQDELRPLTHYVGSDYRGALDIGDFTYHTGTHGDSSKHSYSSAVVVGVVDECIDQGNPAWLDSSSGSSSRLTSYDCDPATCTPGGVEDCADDDCPGHDSTPCHGTRVLQLLGGDFMDGQASSVSRSSEQKNITGVCRDCRLIFIQDQNLNEVGKTLDKACDLGIDVLNLSLGTASISCDGTGSFDEEIEALTACDTVVVAAAGNEGNPTTGAGECTTIYPADHPMTFAVGGINTYSPCTTAGDYYTSQCNFDRGSSMGGGGESGYHTIIDLAAPFQFGNLIHPETSPVYWSNGAGTSYSAPIAAGSMAVLMDWWSVHFSDSIFYDNRMRNAMLLFGDRSEGTTGSDRRASHYDKRWGAGRVGLVPFDDMSDWTLHRSSRELDADETWTREFNNDNQATFFKIVVWQDGSDYSNEPAILLTANPDGCDVPTKSAITLDNKAMIVFADDTNPLSGCTHIDVSIMNYQLGSSGSRRFHVAAYSATEDERNF